MNRREDSVLVQVEDAVHVTQHKALITIRHVHGETVLDVEGGRPRNDQELDATGRGADHLSEDHPIDQDVGAVGEGRGLLDREVDRIRQISRGSEAAGVDAIGRI